MNPPFQHHTLAANGIHIHIAESGRGPLVILCHGFPELWYSWRHQLTALAAAGFRAVAPDLRGYGQTTAPESIDQYTIMHLAGDLVSLVSALGHRRALLVGHDWGAALTWNAAIMRPDVFPAVAAISVPFQPRRPGRPPIPTYREITRRKGLGDFYMVYFQEPGLAEKELEADLERTLRVVAHICCGATPPEERFNPFMAPGKRLLDDYPTPGKLPAWMDEQDLDVFVSAYRASGFRGPLNWYRNLDRNHELTAPFQDKLIHQPALYITGENDHVRRFAGPAERALPETVPGLVETVIIPGGGHWVHQEMPAAVNRPLVEFALAHRSLIE